MKRGGLYHALRRGNLRAAIFREAADYDAFERILRQQRVLTPLISTLLSVVADAFGSLGVSHGDGTWREWPSSGCVRLGCRFASSGYWHVRAFPGGREFRHLRRACVSQNYAVVCAD